MRILGLQCCLGWFFVSSIVSQSLPKQLAFQETPVSYQPMEIDSGSTVYDTLKKESRFSEVSILIEADKLLLSRLQDPGRQTTFFAPTNEAISRFLNRRETGPTEEESLRKLQQIIRYHAVPGSLLAQKLLVTPVAKTFHKEDYLEGKSQRIKISQVDDGLRLNEEVLVKEVDLVASNGVIHVVQELLAEPSIVTKTLVEHPNKFSALNLALQITGLDRFLSEVRGVTLLAPSNLAFRNLGCKSINRLFSPQGRKDLEKILRHHMSLEVAYSSSFKHLSPADSSTSEEVTSSSKHKRKHKHSRKNKRKHKRKDKCKHKHKYKCDHPFRKSKDLSMLFGDEARFVVRESPNQAGLWVDYDSRVLHTDLINKNGVVHVIDRVLVPHGVNITTEKWWDDDQYCMGAMAEAHFLE
ncbi:Fasciclin-domain-containing protein [Basidiobolus meristosporus CBS 931.73]|uniref:Fasciclin-domain-containing protein n=1 Tax=Basidiobolus meristosporus CBS 931.73 TaxID=1314790 RepID=A0A1Y1Y7Z9_9FUNG|nr:Fasciclin-domain-containing protein [Basidiobolus meristosporus CBS 931.73]|eukprot:ORX94089.1 Fasciclin-domain-containing protein [Basidiobolus meristosporus CBS 931.73]